MDDPELLDWCIDIRGRDIQIVDYQRAIEVDNLDIAKNYAVKFDHTPRTILELAAVKGSLEIFKWAINSYIFKSDHLKSPNVLAKIMYSVVLNGHMPILNWLQSRHDISEWLFFPCGEIRQSSYPVLPEDVSSAELGKYSDTTNKWMAAAAIQASDRHVSELQISC